MGNGRSWQGSALRAWIPALLPYLALAALAGWQIAAVVARCGGRFIYTLDDAYIHLALAERIAGGWYGINPGEPSAPSSSVLWPFLLAPFARAAWFDLVPLALNLLLAAGCVGVYGRVWDAALPPARLLRPALQIALIPATHLLGLAFTGMEHVLQVLLTACIVLGIARTLRDGRPPGWLAAATILAPLARYECLAVSAAAWTVLALRGHGRAAARGMLGAALALGGFSAFLYRSGVGWLPSSVLAKTWFAEPGGSGLSGYLDRLFRDHAANPALWLLLAVAGIFFAGAVVGLARARSLRDARVLLPGAGAGMALLHLGFGQFGWWDRYEVYAVTAALLIGLAWLGSLRPAPLLAAGLLALALIVPARHYGKNLLATPLAAANIYEQQYQMHRFVREVWRAPVAVNDLGWVAFRNPQYVLDLWGLASPQALRQRAAMYRGERGPEWMHALARQHNVGLAMIYDRWLPHPPGWQRVARLYLGGPQVVAGGDVVSFYVVDPTQAEAVKALLAGFRQTLPAGVRLEIE